MYIEVHETDGLQVIAMPKYATGLCISISASELCQDRGLVHDNVIKLP